MFNRNFTNLILAFLLTICPILGMFNRVVFAQNLAPETTKTITVTLKEKNNASVPQLQASDFQVFQDGVAVPVLFAIPSNEAPLNLAIVIQEGLPDVNLELNTIKQFILNLPTDSRVMVAYNKDNFVDIVQPFTSNLAEASSKLRVVDPYSNFFISPYLNLKSVLSSFNGLERGRNEVLFISDGYDSFNGSVSPASANLYLDQVMREAQDNNITIFTLFSPSPRVKNFFARNSGINSLIYISEQTGGESFYMNFGYVTFDAPLQRFAQLLKQQYLISYLTNDIDKKPHKVKVNTDFSTIKAMTAKEFCF